jgi:hypothetical protein
MPTMAKDANVTEHLLRSQLLRSQLGVRWLERTEAFGRDDSATMTEAFGRDEADDDRSIRS